MQNNIGIILNLLFVFGKLDRRVIITSRHSEVLGVAAEHFTSQATQQKQRVRRQRGTVVVVEGTWLHTSMSDLTYRPTHYFRSGTENKECSGY